MKYDMIPSMIEGDLQLQNPSLKSIFKKIYLETYSNDENWGNLYLNKLANELGLYLVYLSRKFPEYFNVDFADYIREKKLEQGKFISLK